MGRARVFATARFPPREESLQWGGRKATRPTQERENPMTVGKALPLWESSNPGDERNGLIKRSLISKE